MIDLCMMLRVIDALPWPENKKPVLTFRWCPLTGARVLLHETIARGWGDVSSVSGCTPERVLAIALEHWIMEKGLNNDPRFFDALRRLQN